MIPDSPRDCESALTCVVQSCLSPSWGGLEMSTLRFARALAAPGRRSWMLCRRGAPLERAAAEARIDHLPVTLAGRDHFVPTATRHLRRWIRRQRPAILHAHRSTDLWLLRQAAWGLDPAPRLLLTSRIFFRRQRKRGWLHRWLYAGVDRIIALSSVAREHLLQLLPVPPERITVIPNGVDLERFATGADRAARRRSVRAALGIDPEVSLLGVVGRLDPKKGQDDAIGALARLGVPHDRCELVLVGDETAGETGTADRLRELARRAGVAGRVHFLGHRDDVPALLTALDLFLLPSHEENFGNVLLEAMAAEVAIIGTRAGGTPEILEDGAAGLLVPPRDPGALAAAITALLSDDARRTHQAARARRRVEQHYTFPRVLARTLELYVETVSAPRPARRSR